MVKFFEVFRVLNRELKLGELDGTVEVDLGW